MSTLWNYKEAASFLNVAVGTLYAKVCRKEIPHLRLSGRLVRFDSEEIEQWVAAHSVKDQRIIQPNDC
jgi:excisionase family DNA binding protein